MNKLNSTKEQVLERLILPIQKVFGQHPDASVKWLLANCTQFSPDTLDRAANHIIATCESFPLPALIMKALNTAKPKVSNVVTL